MAREDRGEILHRLGYGTRIADDLHRQRGRAKKGVERKHREYRIERLGRRRAAGVNQTPRQAGRGKIGIDDRQLVAVSHRCQCLQEVGVQQRMDALEHASVLSRKFAR